MLNIIQNHSGKLTLISITLSASCFVTASFLESSSAFPFLLLAGGLNSILTIWFSYYYLIKPAKNISLSEERQPLVDGAKQPVEDGLSPNQQSHLNNNLSNLHLLHSLTDPDPPAASVGPMPTANAPEQKSLPPLPSLTSYDSMKGQPMMLLLESDHKQDATPLDEQHTLDFSPLPELLVEAIQKFKSHFQRSSQDKPIVPFLGDTGSGKSAWIAALAGAELEAVKVAGSIRVDYPSTELHGHYPAIGHSYQSETLVPGLYSIQAENYLLVDFPGFGDTRGAYFKIISNLLTECTFRFFGSTQAMVFVIEKNSMIGGHGEVFKELCLTLHSLFINLKSIQNSFVFIISKSDPDFSLNDFNDIILEFQKLAHKKIEEISTSTSSFRMEEISIICQQLDIYEIIIHAIEDNRVFIADLNNQPHKTLNAFKEKIKSMKPIEDSQINFKHYDKDRMDFDRYILDSIREQVERFKDYKECIHQLSDLKQKIDILCEKSLLIRIKKMKNHLARQKNDLITSQETLDELQKKLRAFDSNPYYKSNIVLSKQHFNANTWKYFNFLKLLIKKKHTFSFEERYFLNQEPIPIQYVKKTHQNGYFLQENLENLRQGEYSVEYYADPSHESSADVTAYVQIKDHPNHVIRCSLLERDIDSLQESIRQRRDTKNQLSKKINELESKVIHSENLKENILDDNNTQPFEMLGQNQLKTLKEQEKTLLHSKQALEQTMKEHEPLCHAILFMAQYIQFPCLTLIEKLKTFMQDQNLTEISPQIPGQPSPSFNNIENNRSILFPPPPSLIPPENKAHVNSSSTLLGVPPCLTIKN